jgi:hypothetical protein
MNPKHCSVAASATCISLLGTPDDVRAHFAYFFVVDLFSIRH